jgi:NADP-dependent aldehyde dehydrogenase
VENGAALTVPEVEAALAAADAARLHTCCASVGRRALWLNTIADALDANADYLVTIARHETRLPEPRLREELAHTSFATRSLAKGLIERTLLRPDPQRGFVSVGPVLVFAAGGFPFELSVAGSDTASAIAVGCPVVVKAHEGHPDLSRATARIVVERLARIEAPRGLLRLLEGGRAGVVAASDRRIRAVAGSQEDGRHMAEVAMARPDPIPFYAESVGTDRSVSSSGAAALRFVRTVAVPNQPDGLLPW